jgi:ribosomal protein S21
VVDARAPTGAYDERACIADARGSRRAVPSQGERHGDPACWRGAAGHHASGAGVVHTRGTPRPAGGSGGQAMLAITVHHNDVEGALRLLKRQLQRSGLLRELRRRRQYEKPSERRRRRKREGIRNTRKRARLAHG